MKILIADDSRVMRQIVIRTLRQAGYSGHQYIEAGDGEEALTQYLRHTPDLVLSDWNMPLRSGIDLLRALRLGGSRVPFGFITFDGTEEIRKKAKAAGARVLITKPFTPESFAAELSPVLGPPVP